jgi:pSer/pThr/pTyr-binding forkhead associated (FHA) protein
MLFEDGSLSIEDLGSANGTYVNRARTFGRLPLNRGDWIALGTYEIEVLQQVSVEVDDEDEDRLTPISGVGVLGQVALSKGSPESQAADTDRTQRVASTDEDFESAGRLADRMFAAGRPQASEQILAGPIFHALEIARAGNLPTTARVDALGHYALRLANATGEGRWVDAAIEAHLLVARPLRVDTLRQLASLRSRIHIGDDALIARYYETMRSRLGSMGPEDRILVSLFAELVLGVDGNR